MVNRAAELEFWEHIDQVSGVKCADLPAASKGGSGMLGSVAAAGIDYLD